MIEKRALLLGIDFDLQPDLLLFPDQLKLGLDMTRLYNRALPNKKGCPGLSPFFLEFCLWIFISHFIRICVWQRSLERLWRAIC